MDLPKMIVIFHSILLFNIPFRHLMPSTLSPALKSRKSPRPKQLQTLRFCMLADPQALMGRAQSPTLVQFMVASCSWVVPVWYVPVL